MVRKIRIWELPDFVRIQLDDETRIALFEKLLNFTGTLAGLLNVIQKKSSHNIRYETLRQYRFGNHFIPLKIVNFFINEFFSKKYYEHLERKIVAFRGSRGDAIQDPCFPWVEDERLIRTVLHLIGDGHGGGPVGKGRVPMYSNTCTVLINQFKEDLSVFGCVKTREYRKKGFRVCVTVEFPKVIGHILKHLYDIDFMGSRARLSKIIYKLPKKLVTEAIKIFGDDEGSVKNTEIHFYSANKYLLQDMVFLVKRNFPEFKTTTSVRMCAMKKVNNRTYVSYYFAILASDLLLYSKLINFYHPKKMRRLQHQLKCQQRVKNNMWNYTTKEKILEALFLGPKTSYELAVLTGVTHRTINKHINGYSDKKRTFKGLKQLNLVRFHTYREGVVWEITNNGNDYKFHLGSLSS